MTDLGTEFGVEVTRREHHFARLPRIGRVQVVAADGNASAAAHILHENESARVEKGRDAVAARKLR